MLVLRITSFRKLSVPTFKVQSPTEVNAVGKFAAHGVEHLSNRLSKSTVQSAAVCNCGALSFPAFSRPQELGP